MLNENLFSCDDVMLDYFIVWSHTFVYFNFYFIHLVVKHPVCSKRFQTQALIIVDIQNDFVKFTNCCFQSYEHLPKSPPLKSIQQITNSLQIRQTLIKPMAYI